MEVDLSALNGKVHFADDEKFMIPSNRNIDSGKSTAFNQHLGSGGVSSYMSQKKTTGSSQRHLKGSGVRQTSV